MIRSETITAAVLLIAFILPPVCRAEAPDKVELKRMKYNHPGLVVDLGVGLWGWPLPLDYDQDGDLDLLVSCPDKPFNGIYFFENPNKENSTGKRASGDAARQMPIFKRPVKVGPGTTNISLSVVDGKPHVLVPGAELQAALQGDFQSKTKLYPQTRLVESDRRIRANQWYLVDYDGNGAMDLVVGHGLWDDYGWDDAFNEQGQWERGPLHGHVYVIPNRGTNDKPEYGEPFAVQADGANVDVFGMPSPNFADFDGDGDLDLLCGDFLDGFTYFANVGSRTEPRYAAGRELARDGEPIEMHLCMIVVSAIDWDGDDNVDLVVGQEDGRVALLRHTGKVEDDMPIFEDPVFFQQQAEDVKFGALVTPVSFDWDHDGDEDLVCGNTAGEIGWIENLDGGDPPRWAAPKLLEVDGKPIRIMAGPNGSIQGPAEAKWGYTTIDVADWNHDGLPDIIANSIWGKVVWFRNEGELGKPELAPAQPISVQWPGAAPKPDWNWWDPTGDELATQWRTTPAVIDWDGDGLNDLVMLDHEGYLALFPRQREGRELKLLPGRRIFRGGSYDHFNRTQESDGDLLRLNKNSAGKSGRRKIAIVDWDGDGKRDLLVNSVNINWLRQISSDEDTVRFQDAGKLSDRVLAGHTTSPTVVDWDGDGKPKLLVGAEDGYFYYQP